MTEEVFERQIQRLSSQWKNSYGPERKALLWEAFKNETDETFTDAVSECLGTLRGAPLVEDLSKACQNAKTRHFKQAHYTEKSVLGEMYSLASKNRTADRDFVAQCLRLLTDYQNRKITKAQFEQGCDLLDQAAKLHMSAKGLKWKPKPKSHYEPGAPKYGVGQPAE